MKNRLIKTYMPLVEMGEITIALAIGEPEVSLGEMVDLRDMVTMDRRRDMFVRDITKCEIKELPEFVLNAYGATDFTEIREDITEYVGTPMPAETTVTVVMMGDPETDLNVVYEETESWEELTSDDDIPELAFPHEDDVEEDMELLEEDPSEE